MIVFKALKKTGFGAIAKKSIMWEKYEFSNGGHFEPEVKLTFSWKRLNFNNLDKKCQKMPKPAAFIQKDIISMQMVLKNKKEKI